LQPYSSADLNNLASFTGAWQTGTQAATCPACRNLGTNIVGL
jgi:hypothetical protein